MRNEGEQKLTEHTHIRPPPPRISRRHLFDINYARVIGADRFVALPSHQRDLSTFAFPKTSEMEITSPRAPRIFRAKKPTEKTVDLAVDKFRLEIQVGKINVDLAHSAVFADRSSEGIDQLRSNLILDYFHADDIDDA